MHHKNQIMCNNNVTPPPTALKCPLLEAPDNGRINCSSSEPVYSSECLFSCDKDYALRGHELLTCDRHGNWTGDNPTCQGKISNKEKAFKKKNFRSIYRFFSNLPLSLHSSHSQRLRHGLRTGSRGRSFSVQCVTGHVAPQAFEAESQQV